MRHSAYQTFPLLHFTILFALESSYSTYHYYILQYSLRLCDSQSVIPSRRSPSCLRQGASLGLVAGRIRGPHAGTRTRCGLYQTGCCHVAWHSESKPAELHMLRCPEKSKQ